MSRHRRSNTGSGGTILPTRQEQKENLKKLQETFPWDREGELDIMSRGGTHSPIGRAVHNKVRRRSSQNSTSRPNPRFGSFANAVKQPLNHSEYDHKAPAPQKPTKLTYISDAILRLRINFEDFEARNFLSEHLLKDYQSENLEPAIDNFKRSRVDYIQVLEDIKKYLPLDQNTKKIHKLFEDLLVFENILLNIYSPSQIKNKTYVTGENINNILKHNIIPPKKILDKIYTHIKDNSLTYLGFEIAGSHAISRLSTIEPTRYTEQKALNNAYQKMFKNKEPCKAHFTIMYLLSINGCEQARQSLEQFSLKLEVDTAVEVDTADRKAEPQKNIVLTPEARDQLEASRRSKSPRELRQVSDSPSQNSLNTTNQSFGSSSIPGSPSPRRSLNLPGSVSTSRSNNSDNTDPDATRVLNREGREAQVSVNSSSKSLDSSRQRDGSSSPESLGASSALDEGVTRGLSPTPHSPLPQGLQGAVNDSEERDLNNMSTEELRDRVKELERSNQVLREEKQVLSEDCQEFRDVTQEVLARENEWVDLSKILNTENKTLHAELKNRRDIQSNLPSHDTDTAKLRESTQRLRQMVADTKQTTQTPGTGPEGQSAENVSKQNARTKT